MTSLFATLGNALPRPDGERSLTLSALKARARSLPAAFDRLPPTRFSRWPALAAALLLAALAALTIWGAALGAQPDAGAAIVAIDPTKGDVALYHAVTERMAAGESYYAAVVAEHRLRGYPLRPVVTVRLPTLATLHAWLGPVGAAILLAALTVLAWALLLRRMVPSGLPKPMLATAGMLAAFGLMPGLIPASADWHEGWAAVLIVLSLACRTPERWFASVMLGLAAVAFRELALPYLGVMALTALVEGNRREAAAWAVAVVLFATMLGAHALALSGLLLPHDLVSPGWAKAGGWPLVLSMLSNCSSLGVFLIPLTSCLAIFALLGWVAWPGGFGLRGALLVTGYAGAFMLIGRKENVYWGLLWGPLLPLGLAFALPASRDLLRAAMRRPSPIGARAEC